MITSLLEEEGVEDADGGRGDTNVSRMSGSLGPVRERSW